MSFLQRIVTKTNNEPYDTTGLSFSEKKSSSIFVKILNFFRGGNTDIPSLRFSNGREVHGLPGNMTFKSLYNKEAPKNMSLEEYTLRNDFAKRYAKTKPTRRHLIKPGDTVVEVGAYLGYHAMKTAERVGPSGRVIALEMMPDLHHILQLNLEGNFGTRCQSICAAISTESAEQKAFVGGAQANGFRKDVIEVGKRVAKTQIVKTHHLGDLLDELGLQRIDLLTLQVNGTEPEILNSLSPRIFNRVKGFAVAANYDVDGNPISHQIAGILRKHKYDTEIYDNWVYALKNNSQNQAVETEQPSPIFIGGCGRSGTTLLRTMLDSHPLICSGPETNLIIEPQNESYFARLADKFSLPEDEVIRMANESSFLPQFMTAFGRYVTGKHGKKHWADKTPRNVRHLKYIFDNFPSARFIHVIRDGRDVTNSLKTHPKYKVVEGKLIETGIQNPYEDCCKRWIEDVTLGLEWHGDNRVLPVMYEELVANPRATMIRILDFLELPWSDAILHHENIDNELRNPMKYPNNALANQSITKAGVGRWKSELSMEEIQYFNEHAGALLSSLGYEE